MQIRRWFLLIFVAVAILITSVLTGHRLPLYDGVANPDEPYRYVKPPSEALKTKLSPTSAQQTITLQNGASSAFLIIPSQEYGPQVTLYLGGGSLPSSGNAKQITVSVVPLAPVTNHTNLGTIAGNVYYFSAKSDQGTVGFINNTSNPASIDLRLPQGYSPGAIFIYQPTRQKPWSKLSTSRVGNDIYEAQMPGYGYYALIGSKLNNQKTSSPYWKLIIALIILISIGMLIILIIRLTHKSSSKNH